MNLLGEFVRRVLATLLLSMLCLVVFAQGRQITGTVVSSTEEPVIGANVLVVGTTNGVISDIEGNFSLSDVPSNAKIQVSFIGFVTQTLSVGNQTHIKVVLKDDSKLLDEVVVVGFGTQKKVNLTGAIGVATAEDLELRPVANVVQALQGLVPGLQIMQTNGSLEDRPSINVRGTTTIGEGTSGVPLVLIDGMEGDINSVNPQDIMNISVLKDAAASSIYGSRAPFGVILITTKSGKTEGKTVINYNNSFRWGTPINMNHSMNSVDFASWMNDASTNGGNSVFFDTDRMNQIVAYHNATPSGPGQRTASDGTVLYSIGIGSDGNWLNAYQHSVDDVDWYSEIYKKWNASQEHNFSVSGGTNLLNYYASFNYLNQDGFMKLGEEGLNRYNGTAKIGSEVTKWLKFNYTMRFTREDYHRPAAMTGDSFYGRLVETWPVIPLYDRNGYYYDAPALALRLAEGGTDKIQTDHMYQQVGFKIEPVKNWITHLDFNYRTQSANRHWGKLMTYNHNVEGAPYVSDNISNVHEDYLKTNYYNFNAYTEYTRQFKEKHNFHVMVGFQAENLKQTEFGLTRNGIMFPSKPEIDLTTGLDYYGKEVTPTTNGARNEWSTAGFFGRLNYDYEGKYLAEVNLRYDGTSRFRSDNRWKMFPSFSLGWNMAREAFFEPLNDIVSVLKVRASYGSLGNQNTTNWYQTYQTMAVGSANGAWLINGLKPNTAIAPGLVSESLGWETIESYNIGLDWGLFNNRLTGSFDYYIRNTKDMVGKAPELPAILGTGVPVTNNTDLRTSGWELSLGWNDRLNNGVAYSVKFNLSDSRSKITRYPNNPTNSIWSPIEGHYLNEIWGYETIGIAKTDEEMQQHLASLPNGGQDAVGSSWAAGDVMYKDVNNDGKISTGTGTLGDSGDVKKIGNSTPRYLFGIDLNASWKGFDLRAFFQGVMKRDYFQGSSSMFGTNTSMWFVMGLEEVGDYFRDGNTWSVQNGYQGENLNAYLPRPLYSDKNLQWQSRYMQNAAYIRLKNLQIGYTLPTPLTLRWGIEKVRVYFSGENLWTGTSLVKQFDPETISGGYGGNAYPLSTTLSCGLSVTF